MATVSLRGVLRQVRELAGPQSASELTDGELLDCFLAEQDQAAFEALVVRHGPMVQQVCQRILSDVHASEDAFQAVFLVLARKAPSIRRRSSVGGWLYHVAYHVAVRAKTQANRRNQREQEAGSMQPTASVKNPEQRETSVLVEQQLARLPEKYRTPLVLCYLEGKSQVEAAQQLGCPASSLASRLLRGRELLRSHLASRGLVLSAGGLAALLSEGAASAALPAETILQTVQAVCVGAGTPISSAGALALADSVLHAMAAGRRALVLVTLLCFGTLGLAAGVSIHQVATGSPGDLAGAPWDASEPGGLVEPRNSDVLTLLIDDGGRITTPGMPEPLTEAAALKKFLAERFEQMEQRALARQRSRTDLGLTALVRAHPDVPHLAVLSLLRECHAVGFPKLSLTALPCEIDLAHGHHPTARLRIHADAAGDLTALIVREADKGETMLVDLDQLQRHLKVVHADNEQRGQAHELQVWSAQPIPFGRYVAVASVAVQTGTRLLHLGPSSVAEVRECAAPAPSWAEAPPQRRPHGVDEAGRIAALTAGFDWLAQHQSDDGSWSAEAFHLAGKCSCSGPGSYAANAAGAGRKVEMSGTAFALLPLLRGGFTHQGNGRHARTVERGLKYLLGLQSKDGSFSQDMYQNGLAALALCEAYARSRDANLRQAAQQAVDFIVDAQHEGGGWRYRPKMAGDLSITGWQVQVLRVAYQAGLKVPDETIRKANLFLDSVSTPDGSGYGYVGPMPTPTMTANGMLCRAWLVGEPSPQPGWSAAVDYLRKLGPEANYRSMYHYYHATQAMNQDDAAAARWNPAMNKRLIEEQDWGGDPQRPHQHGSWSPADDNWGRMLGRVGQTSLALLTLQATKADVSAASAEPRTARELAILWDDLASDNGFRASVAVQQLIAVPAQALPLLNGRLRPVAEIDGKLAQRWLVELDSDKFAARQQAEEELEKLGEGILPTLRQALAAKPSLEKGQRLERILQRFEGVRPTPAQRQALRGLRVLESVGTPDARKQLEALAGGAPGVFLTREANNSLERLAARK